MSRWIRKSVALVSSVVTVAAMSLVATATPANAATTAVTATLVSPTRTYTISTAGWSQYYGTGINDGAIYADAGSTTVITYHFVDQNSAPLVATAVSLHVNKDYSGSNASFVGGTSTQFTLNATTDSNGDASFTLVNNNTDAQAQARPASTSTAAATAGRIYTQVYPTLLGLAQTAVGGDMLEINYIKSLNAATASPTPTATSTSGGLASCVGVTSNFISNEPFANLTVTGNGTKTGSDWNADNTDLTFQYSDASKACQKIQVVLYQISSGITLSTVTGTGSNNCEAGPWAPGATGDRGCFITLDNTGTATFHVGVTGAGAGKSLKYMLVGPGWSSAASGGTATINFVAGGASPSVSTSGTSTASATPTPTATGAVPAAVKITLDSTTLAGPGSSVGNGWYHGNAPANNYVQYVVAGQSFTLSYLVKDAATDTAVGADVPVTLSVTKAGSGVANFTGSLSATTNASGIATFSLTNTNTDADAEVYRSDLTTWTDVPAGSPEYKADFAPSVTGATNAATAKDLVWTHVVSSSASTASPTATSTAPAVGRVKIKLASADAANTLYKDVLGVSKPVGNTWWNGNAPSNNYVKYVDAGSTLTLHYEVTNTADVSVGEGVTVTLTVVKGGAGVANFTGSLTATTDASGVATFTLVNTNTNSTSEFRRADMTAWSDVPAGTSEYKYDITPSVAGSTADVADLVWTHVVSTEMSTATPTPTATATATSTPTPVPSQSGGPWTIRQTTFDDSNSTNQTATAALWVANTWYHAGLGYREAHVMVGTSKTITYHVTDGNGDAAPGIIVSFVFNKQYSTSNANVTVSGTSGSGESNSIVTGTTDANGDVSFTLVSTDSFVSGKVFTQVAAYVSNPAVDTIDMLDVIYDADPNATPSPTPSSTATEASNVCGGNTLIVCPPISLVTVSSEGTPHEVANGSVSLDVNKNVTFNYTSNSSADAGKQVQINLFSLSTGLEVSVPHNAGLTWSSTACFDDGSNSQCQLKLDADGNASFTATFTGNTEGASFKYKMVGTGYDSEVVDAYFGTAPTPTPTASPTPTSTLPRVKITLASADAASTLFTDVDGVATPIGNTWWNGNAPSNNYVKYVYAGSDLTLRYNVTDTSDVSVGAGVTVTLSEVKGGAGVANFTGSLSAVTDANGVATFTLTNTNAVADAEAPREDSSVWSDATGDEYKYDLTPAATGYVADVADLVWTHVVSPTPPTAPRLVSVKAASATSVLVSWSAPASNGNSPITGYSYTLRNNGVSVSGKSGVVSGTSVTLTGLLSSGKYSVLVAANNAVGGSASASSVGTVSPSATAPKAPGAPTSVKTVWVASAYSQATVYWTAPTLNNNSSLLRYSVLVKKAGVTIDTLTVLPSQTVSVGTATFPGVVVTGLDLGSSYTFVVSATNSIGSTAAAPTAALIPAIAPGAPTLVNVVRGSKSATVSWTAPESNGGSAITGYTVTCTAGLVTKTASGTATGTSAVVKSLVNGTEYTCKVAAKNAKGTSVASSTQTVTPATVPSAPIAVAGVSGNGQVTVNWTASAVTGGSALTGFTVSVKVAGVVVSTVAAEAADRSAVVTGLNNGTAHTFSVVATNSVGNSAAKTSASVTPATTPGVPTIGTTLQTSGTTSLTAKWTAPSSNGGSAITGYEVKVFKDGSWVKTVSATATASSLVVTGLTTKTAYTFTVAAKNAKGTGTASSASVAVSTK